MMSIDLSNAEKEMPGLNLNHQFKDKKLDSLLDLVYKLDTMGISKIKFDWIDTSRIFIFSYNFNQIETLNEMLISSFLQNEKSMEREDFVDFEYFKRKGKSTLTYNFLIIDSLAYRVNKSQKKNYKYNFVFYFDRKIKKVDNPKVRLSSSKKKATLKTNIYDMYQAGFKKDIKFKFE